MVVNVKLVNGGWINGQKQVIDFGEITIGGFNQANNVFNWWIWIVIAATILLLILLIVWLVLLIKKRKIRNAKIAAPLAPPRPVTQQLAYQYHLLINQFYRMLNL